MIQFLPVIYILAVVGWWRAGQFLYTNQFIRFSGSKTLWQRINKKVKLEKKEADNQG